MLSLCNVSLISSSRRNSQVAAKDSFLQKQLSYERDKYKLLKQRYDDDDDDDVDDSDLDHDYVQNSCDTDDSDVSVSFSYLSSVSKQILNNTEAIQSEVEYLNTHNVTTLKNKKVPCPCMFCGKFQTNLHRYIVLKHSQEDNVKDYNIIANEN